MIAYTGKPECDIRDVLIAELTSQRDELLAAMRKAVVAAAHPFNEARNECYNILDEAIRAHVDSAKGGA